MAACGWTVDWPTSPCSSASLADKQYAETIAAEALWALSGRVFGVCPTVVRPCGGPVERPSTYAGPSGGIRFMGPVTPTLAVGCGCDPACGCGVGRDRVALPGPVNAVTAVWVNGVQLPNTTYRVRDRRWLLRGDGETWPTAQNLAAPDHGAGAFTVEYLRGIPIPAAGLAVLGDLACEFIKARTGSGKCAIPARAQQITRQGVDIQLIDPTTLFDSGLTGVETVDRWLASVNPTARRAPSRVYSPDGPTVARMR